LEKKDLELIELHRKTNYDLEKLFQEHIVLESEIDKLEAVKVLTTSEEKKLHKFKKDKLDGRDKIEKILKKLRN